MDKEQHEESSILDTLELVTNGKTVPAEVSINGKTEKLTINTKDLVQNLKWLNTQPDEITADNTLKILRILETTTINDIPSEYYSVLDTFLTNNLLYQETISKELNERLTKLQDDLRNRMQEV